MDSNTHSGRRPARLAALTAAVDELAAQDLVGQTDAVLADQVLELRRLLDRLEGHWLQTLAAVDGRGAAGADQGLQVGSTAAWLRGRLRLGAGAAAGWVRTARALYRGPLTQTGQALAAGELSTAHARCWPTAPTTCRTRSPPRPNGAGGGGPPAGPTRLRRVLGHLRRVADPEGAQGRAERQHQRRACGCRPPSRAWSPLRLLEPEAGQTVLAALEPLARPSGAADTRSGGQRRADALAEVARRTLEAGRLPQTGGVRPS